MFKFLNKRVATPIAIIIVCVVLIGGIVVWQYLETQKEGEEITEDKKEGEPITAFLAAAKDSSVIAILYDRVEKKITHEKTIDLNGLRLSASGFEAQGSNDSVQYNIVTNQILLSVRNFSYYDGSSLTDAPYSEAIWVTSFDEDNDPQVIFIPKGNIRHWITHPDKPIIYVLDLVHFTSPKARKAEILEINLLNKKVRKIASVSGDLIQGQHFKLVMSKDGNSIFQAVQMYKPGDIFQGAQTYESDRILLKQIDLVNGEVAIIMNLKDMSGHFDTDNLSPSENVFVFFSGWLGRKGLQIRYLKEQKTEILIPEDLDIANFNLCWSGDNNNLLLLLKVDGTSTPFMYFIKEQMGESIDILTGQYPLAWAPAKNYILFKEGTYDNLRWNIFDLKANKVDNIYSFLPFYSTVAACWIK